MDHEGRLEVVKVVVDRFDAERAALLSQAIDDTPGGEDVPDVARE